jgi:thymidylate kinase
MDRAALEHLLRAGKITTNDLLKQTLRQDLDVVLTLLKRHRPAGEVCTALLEEMATAPLSEFSALKLVYFRHCNAQEQ